ncbi:MAG: adenosylmethionine decarboxylase, partial [Bacteroidetes bacterium QH_8_67_23]
VDVFLCGDCDPRASLPVFERAFAPERIEHRLIERG